MRRSLRGWVFQADYLVFGAVLLVALFFVLGFSGMRMVVEHPLQRTVLPRALVGTPSTFRQSRLGHMIRIVSSIALHSRCVAEIGEGASGRESDRCCGAGGGLGWRIVRIVRQFRCYRTPLSLVVAGFPPGVRAWRVCPAGGSRERDQQR